MISASSTMGSGDNGRHSSLFHYVEPILETLSGPGKPYGLPVIEGYGDEIRDRLRGHLEGGARAPIRKTANDFSVVHSQGSRKIKRIVDRIQSELLTQEKPYSVQQAIDYLRQRNATVVTLVLAVLRAAEGVEQRNSNHHNIARLARGEDEVNSIALPGKIETGDDGYNIGENHRWLYDNKAWNYLRLIGAMPEITYDQVHSRGLYLFTNATQPTQFAHELTGYRNGPDNEVKLIEGKRILEIGPGNGADVDHFLASGAAQVQVIDGSEFVLDRLRARYQESGMLQYDGENRSIPHGRVIVPGFGMEMHDALRYMNDEQEQFDTITAHSCFHYFDDKGLSDLLKSAHAVLKPGGHLAFSVKAPGATLDGHGIKLFEHLKKHQDVEKPESVMTDVRGRMWMNFDGQMRNFRSMDAWVELLSSHFDVLRKTDSDVHNYEAPGRSQKFFNFIARRKEIDLPTQI
ncbi:MAG: class I SAM-dependent methyltransferase [Candidatus Peribacteraceae bacterium]